jgi:hypothetical protein
VRANKTQQVHKMPVTVSYDLADADYNDRNYVRSMFERFGWKRLGGSVFLGMKKLRMKRIG